MRWRIARSRLNFISLTLLLTLNASFSRPPIAGAAPPPPDDLRIEFHAQTGTASVITAPPEAPFHLESATAQGVTPQDSAMVYLVHFQTQLGLSAPSQELQLARAGSRPEAGGGTSRYQQVYRGIPVLAGELVVNTDSYGRLLSINGEISPAISLSIDPDITANSARETALSAIAKGYGVDAAGLSATEPALWIFDERLLRPSARPVELVWRMDVRAVVGAPIDELVLINAHTGGVSLHFNQIDASWSGGGGEGPDEASEFWMRPPEGTASLTPSPPTAATPVMTGQPSPTGTTTATNAPTEASTGTSNPPPPAATAENSLTPTLDPSGTGSPTATPSPTKELFSSPTPSPTSTSMPAGEAALPQEGPHNWYVSTGGDDADDCLSPTTPCASIQAALEKAEFLPGDTVYITTGDFVGAGESVISISEPVILSGGWDSSFLDQIGWTAINGEEERVGIDIGDVGGQISLTRFIVRKGHTDFYGGGITIEHGSTVTLNDSAVVESYSGSNGGGIGNSGDLTLNNSTISGNYNPAYRDGAGIFTSNTGTTQINSSTITNNRGSGVESGSEPITIRNSILAGNDGPDGPLDCSGSIESLGNNILGEISSCSTILTSSDQVGVDPRLGPIIMIGAYHPLAADSPAIDSGNPAGCEGGTGALLYDQRGAPRVGFCDIGAYEYTTPGTGSSIYPANGTPQRAAPDRELQAPLQAVVLDDIGSPVGRSLVSFSSPASGPGGTFKATHETSTDATTDEFGIAQAAAFIANSEFGSYQVIASVEGIPGQAVFELTNFVWFVSVDGDDANDCITTSTECASLNAIYAKPDFRSGDTIFISEGTFTGSGDRIVLIDQDSTIIGGWDETFSHYSGRTTLDGEFSRQGALIDNFVEACIEDVDFMHGWDAVGSAIRVGSDALLTLKSSNIGDNLGRAVVVSPDGRATIQDCAIYENTGSGIANFGHLSVSNCTISANSDGEGGGINNDGDLVVNNATIANNFAQYDGGGISNIHGDRLSITNSILARNVSASNSHDCAGVIESSNYNLIEDTTNCLIATAPTDIVGVSPRIAPLAASGARTSTHALLVGSPAINVADPAEVDTGEGACESTDQRGVTRPIGPRCDIGAFEGSGDGEPSGSMLIYDANNWDQLPGTFICSHLQPECTEGLDPHADAALLHVAQAYDFYMNRHERDSFDELGMKIISSVHFDAEYANAFWSSFDNQLVFGDAYGYPLADDVVAHEFTHGMTQYSSNLFYYYQSGAISESLSDLWGEFMDQTNGTGDDSPGVKWLIGEDVEGLGAIRSMADPPLYEDPDRMTSEYYYTGSADLGYFGDDGGVHTNSGVNNKAVFLMVDGGNFNGQAVAGIGIDKVAAIYYEAQTRLLTSGSDYADLYNLLPLACGNLMGGDEGISAADCDQVTMALDAVEMNASPSSGYNPEAAACPSGLVPDDLFYDDFEDGSAKWTLGSFAGSSSWAWASGNSPSGTPILWGDDSDPLSDAYVEMKANVALPSGSQPYLHITHAFGFEDPDYDGGWIQLSDDGGSSWHEITDDFQAGRDYNGWINSEIGNGDNPHTGQRAFVGDSHGYVSSRYDLSGFAGDDIRLRFRTSTDSYFFDWGWFIDQVRIYTCVPAPPPSDQDSVGLFNPLVARFFLRNAHNNGAPDYVIRYGKADSNWVPLTGDWDGDGVDSIGIYNPDVSRFMLRDTNTTGPPDYGYRYGPAGEGWLPIVGDWDGDGADTVGVFDPTRSLFLLANNHSPTSFDVRMFFGPPDQGWVVVSGDWDGNGVDTLGVYNPATGEFRLRNSNTTGGYDISFIFGPGGEGWIPITGDWDADGVDTVGIYNPVTGQFRLRNGLSFGPPDLAFRFGAVDAGWLPVSGDWDGE
jgi:Zn-dependent metalloprotease